MTDKPATENFGDPAFCRLYTTAEVADLLRVSPPTVRVLKQTGRLTAVAGLRQLRFPAWSVAALIAKDSKKGG
jgi:excisionase family DNA binding protein